MDVFEYVGSNHEAHEGRYGYEMTSPRFFVYLCVPSCSLW